LDYHHIPVLFDECIEGLKIKEDGIYVDGTVGGGGHSRGIVEKLKAGRLIAIDLDEEALFASKKALANYADKITFVHGNYKEIPSHLDSLNIGSVDGVLLDLGVSSFQLDAAERGFSYMKDAPLDMRMDASSPLSAYEVINDYPEERLSKIFFEYGEERYSRRVAASIIKIRREKPIGTTGELASLIISAYPKNYREGHPAKRVFQAVRIEVNGEIEGLYGSVIEIARRLKTGGRMAVITFHSLEDRAVKQAFKELETDCVCDKSLPVCVCGKKREAVIVTKNLSPRAPRNA